MRSVVWRVQASLFSGVRGAARCRANDIPRRATLRTGIVRVGRLCRGRLLRPRGLATSGRFCRADVLERSGVERMMGRPYSCDVRSRVSRSVGTEPRTRSVVIRTALAGSQSQASSGIRDKGRRARSRVRVLYPRNRRHRDSCKRRGIHVGRVNIRMRS